MDKTDLLETLNSVTAIPIVPFRAGAIDFDGHRKNIRYLMKNNYLDGNRKRVIGIAGTSLIHHFSFEDKIRIIEVTSEEMASQGILMSGIVPNPLVEVERLIARQAKLRHAPDVYLIMPLSGVADHEAIYDTYINLTDKLGMNYGANFLLYMRSKEYVNPIIRLVNDSPHIIGVKVGTSEKEIGPLVKGIGDQGIVMWGIGDRSTRAAELGTKGHTSGLAILAARAVDEINNAQRKQDYKTSAKLESCIKELEYLRFINGRQFNYSAIIEALIIGGWDDVEAGEGAPFNPRLPRELADRVTAALEPIREYH